MGIDPAILHSEKFARLLSKDERKKAGVQTAAEANAKCEARSERELQDQICAYLTLRGVKRIVRSAMHRKSTTPVGTPDLLFCFHKFVRHGPYVSGKGIPFAFEVKVGNAQPTPEQKQALKDFMGDGWNVRVIRSLDEVKQILDSL